MKGLNVAARKNYPPIGAICAVVCLGCVAPPALADWGMGETENRFEKDRGEDRREHSRSFPKRSRSPHRALTSAGQRLPQAPSDAYFHYHGDPKPEKVRLGRFLFYDKILSGNKNISCATCHHDLTATGDGLSLPVGEGGDGLGVTRNLGSGPEAIHARVPRNATHLFNKGARPFVRMFWDGRVEVDPNRPSGFRTPAGKDLPQGLDNVLAAQAMFPVTSSDEMAGQPGENPIADAAANGNLAGPGGVWDQVADRLRRIPEYVELFREAFPQVGSATDIRYRHAANALAAFQTVAYRADQSPFDRFLRGEKRALTGKQRKGMRLFYGKAKCSTCHSGPFQTDHRFHSICVPQIGPGKGDGPDGLSDFGRERVTGNREDRYRFRTPSLRNVVLTGPWGHDGAYNDLETMVRHHTQPKLSMREYDPTQAVLPSRPDLDRLDFRVWKDPYRRQLIAASEEMPDLYLSSKEMDALMAFLESLTDPGSLDTRRNVPMKVPSGLPVAE